VGIFWRPAHAAPGEDATGDGTAIQGDAHPEGRPVVFVGMSRDVADLRWTVENDAERAIARAARAGYRYLAGE
jgi:hypothetical protein